MILALDVGNTNTVVGGFEGSALRFSLRMQSDRNKTVDEYVLLLRGLLAEKEVDLSTVEGGIISSVVPELRYVLGKAMERLTGKTFLVVSSRLDLGGIRIKMDIPGQVGADLLVDAAAALSLYRPPLVIFDMGTATTMSVLDREGSYIGGVIIPGLRLSMDALSGRAAQLPFINLEEPPERLIGKHGGLHEGRGHLLQRRHAGRTGGPGGGGTGREGDGGSHWRPHGRGAPLLQA